MYNLGKFIDNSMENVGPRVSRSCKSGPMLNAVTISTPHALTIEWLKRSFAVEVRIKLLFFRLCTDGWVLESIAGVIGTDLSPALELVHLGE